MEVTFGNNFDFEKTYSEYGFVTLENCIDRFKSLFFGIVGIHFLHNCVVVKTMNLGTGIDFLTEVKDKMGALAVAVGVAVFTPYIKDETNSLGLVYNVFFDKNCCPVKYPKK